MQQISKQPAFELALERLHNKRRRPPLDYHGSGSLRDHPFASLRVLGPKKF